MIEESPPGVARSCGAGGSRGAGGRFIDKVLKKVV